MTITLNASSTTVTLHPDLYWEDEFSWYPVEQGTERTLTGALIVDAVAKVLGRPITLKPDSDGSAWMPKATIDQLAVWAQTPLLQMTLSLRGASYQVLFRHDDPPALSVEPVVFYSDPGSTDFYLATIKLLVIA